MLTMVMMVMRMRMTIVMILVMTDNESTVYDDAGGVCIW